VVWWCLAVAVAFLMCGFSSPWRSEFLAPGPLASHHAQVLSKAGIDRCAACHAAATQPVEHWLALTVGFGHHAHATQSDLCLKCHGDSLGQRWAASPHSVAPESLQALTVKHSGRDDAAPRLAALACSACHREHQGPEHDLTRLTDRQCQTCHANYYHSFESTHAEFSPAYPARRASRIRFDHAAHQARYFAERSHPFDCRECHRSDAAQNVQLLDSFDRACQACHQEQIAASEPLIALSLPLIDCDAIRNSGNASFDWPAAAGGQFDGAISPLLRVLLDADADAAFALRELGSGFQFGDVDSTRPEQVRLAATAAAGIRKLIEALAADPRSTLRNRMSTALSCRPDSPALEQWLDTLPMPQLQSLKNSWLAKGIPAGTNGVPVANWSPWETDVLPRREFALRGVPPIPDDELLAPNPLKELMSGRLTSGLAADQLHGQPLPADWSDAASTQAPSPLPGQAETAPEPAAPIRGFAPAAEGAASALAVGWEIDSRTMSVTYHATEHGDAMLRALFELAATSSKSTESRSVRSLIEYLSRELSPGSCGKCHTVERDGDAWLVNWRAQYRDTSRADFTHFSHRPHLVDLAGRSCTSCHRLEPARSVDLSQEVPPNRPHSSGLLPIRKADCVACHRAGLANQACTECHNYHVTAGVDSAGQR
jgi:hypothetical protein